LRNGPLYPFQFFNESEKRQLLEKLLRSLDTYPTSQLPEVLHAVGTLYTTGSVPGHFLDRWLKITHETQALQHWPAHELAMTFYRLAIESQFNHLYWMKSWMEQTNNDQFFKQLNLKEIRYLLKGTAKFSFKFESSWWDKLATHMPYDSFKSDIFPTLSSLISSFGMKEGKFYDYFILNVKKHFKRIKRDSKVLSVLLYNTTQFAPELALELYLTLKKKVIVQNLQGEENIDLVTLNFFYRYHSLFSEYKLKDFELEYLNYSSEVLKYHSHISRSKMQQVFTRKLEQNLSQKVIPEEYIPEIGRTVDIFLPESKVIIEFNGPKHYIQTVEGSYIPNGKQPAKERILKHYGYKVINVPFYEYSQNPGKYVKEFIRKNSYRL
jgi:hypothetical protein